MLKTAAGAVAVDKGKIFEQIFSNFEHVNIADIDKDIKIQDVNRPTKAMAFATYCTSSLWSANVKTSRGLAGFNLKMGDVTIPVYSLKGEQNAK